MRVSHIVVKKGVYSRGRSRFWEGLISGDGGYILRGQGRF